MACLCSLSLVSCRADLPAGTWKKKVSVAFQRSCCKRDGGCRDLLAFWTKTSLCSGWDDREIARDSCVCVEMRCAIFVTSSCVPSSTVLLAVVLVGAKIDSIILTSFCVVGVGHYTLGQLYMHLWYVEYVEDCHERSACNYAYIKSEAIFSTQNACIELIMYQSRVSSWKISQSRVRLWQIKWSK